MKIYPRDQRGFTLIELLVVIAIIGILSAIVMASLQSARVKSRDNARMSSLVQLRNALELYKNQTGSYPIPTPSNGDIDDGSGNTVENGGYGNQDYSFSALFPGLSTTYISPSIMQAFAGRQFLYGSDGNDYHISAEVEGICTNALSPSFPMCDFTLFKRDNFSFPAVGVYTTKAKDWIAIN